MTSFVMRLYGLSIVNFFDFSFFYFYSVKKINVKTLKEKHIKISYLYNKSFNKRNQAFVLYSKLPSKTFSLCNLINSFYIGEKEVITSLSYDNILYNNIYYKSTIREYYTNWIYFFELSRNVNLNYHKVSIKHDSYSKNIILYIFLKQYNYIFNRRFKTIKLIS